MTHSQFGNMPFGEIVLTCRKQHDWTVRELIDQLAQHGYKAVSPAYISRIEQDDEIPSPELTMKLAEVFGVDPQLLLERAKQAKLQALKNALEEKYQRAFDTLQERVERGKQRYGSKS